MTVIALIIMFLVQGTVTCVAGYFFWKVLRTPPKPEPDSYLDNDGEPRN